ncbi:hypothetical protein KY290_003126 [Solanum tuberosum]|uniref:Uncharacterized protein n=1 Tax=Solanum tuberosum TaxID=4113 RepID=A0ABQ7WS30_SOLTU|nr:hypothetical protein KY285_003097 [Solanum tuberosum]KAH0783528.1 hypothetical protein KY290_003126 [Solanum tuberosum]
MLEGTSMEASMWRYYSDCLAKENQMSDTDLFNKQETGLLQLSSHMLGGGSQVKYWFICLAAIIYKGCEVVTSWTFLVQ